MSKNRLAELLMKPIPTTLSPAPFKTHREEAFSDHPDGRLLIEHYIRESDKAAKAGDSRSQWGNIKTICEGCAISLRATEPDRAAYFFYMLGRSTTDLRSQDILDAREKWHREIESARQTGLIHGTASRKFLKEVVQNFAESTWRQDESQSIRTGDMTQMAWEHFAEEQARLPKFKEIYDKYFPDKPEGIREWVREVAPEYAKKRGRPKKHKPI